MLNSKLLSVIIANKQKRKQIQNKTREQNNTQFGAIKKIKKIIIEMLIKNSWDTTWGEEGYVRIEKDVGGMGRCALTYSSVYPTF